MPKKAEKERKKLVVEEVEENPIDNEVVSSTQLEKEEVKEEKEGKPEILEEAASIEVPEEVETPSQEMEKEIHEEEKHLHDIHTGVTPGMTASAFPPKKESNPILWILIPGIFLLGALLGGIVFYQKGISKGETQTPTPVPTIAPVATPTPTALPKADLSKYPIMVQNGSGIPGAAGDAKTILTKAGFTVSGTGNAPTYDYTKTVIESKSDVPQAFIDQLSSTLSGTYVMGTNVTLKDSSPEEVIVIVGSSKAQ